MTILERNNVTQRGAGPSAFVFAHGFGCDQSMWRRVAPAFEAQASVVLFDHVGAGGSDIQSYDPVKYSSLQGYADDLIEVCLALRLERVVFIGHSVSATIGVLAAAKRPDLFGRMVMICPSPRYANTESYRGGFASSDIEELLDLMDKNHLDWSGVMAPAVMGGLNTADQDDWRDSVCRTNPAIAKQFARVTFESDHRLDYQGVTTETLIIDCKDDALAPADVGEYLRNAIHGSRRVTLDVSGHCPHVTAPELVIGAIQNFVGPAHSARVEAA